MRGAGRNTVRFVMVLAVGVGLCGSASAQSGLFAVSGSLTSAPADPMNPLGPVRTLAGAVAPFGDVAGSLTFTSINFQTGRFAATFTLASMADGDDTVFGTINGRFLNAQGTQYVEVITITGGTGRYKGATGVALLTGTVDPMGVGSDVVLGGLVFIPPW